MTLDVEMTFDKSTPGTHVYVAADKSKAAVVTLYIKKFALPDDPPQAIKLTIETAE